VYVAREPPHPQADSQGYEQVVKTKQRVQQTVKQLAVPLVAAVGEGDRGNED
jgi:hypothetical protein